MISFPIYISKEAHLNQFLDAFGSLEDVHHPSTLCVANFIDKRYFEAFEQKAANFISNSENCLSSAWNLAINEAIERKDDKIILSNTDVVFEKGCIDKLYNSITVENPFVTAFITNEGHRLPHESHPNDFSLFGLHIPTIINKVGYFDENIKPAYFEDVDYRIRLEKANIKIYRCYEARYKHLGQQTVKNDQDIEKVVNEAWAVNKAYVERKHGIVL
jgi:GT2 family glycosyltransferase